MYVKLQPYRQHSVVHKSCLKLSVRFFGPYPLLEKIGLMAYKLAFPTTAKIDQSFMFHNLKNMLDRL